MKLQTLFISLALCLCIGGGKLYAQTYYISSRTQLKAFAERVNDETKEPFTGTAYLTVDIDLNNEAWTPIGTEEHPFQGHFEGWGHKISRLSVTGSDDYAGLFGYINGGHVEDLGIESSCIESGDISGGSYVGGICGYLGGGGEISSCYSNVTISGTQCVGGICGKLEGGVIKNCWHAGNIKGNASNDVNTGGLVGHSVSGTLQRCYVKETVITVANIADATIDDYGNSYFGKIVGQWSASSEEYDEFHKPKKLNCCIFNEDNVKIANFNAGDVIVGSQNGGNSPSLKESVMGATTDQMKDRFFWIYDSGSSKLTERNDFDKNILNDEIEEIAKNNEVWYIVNGSYPELHSFYDKDKDITFKFTSTKKWLTIVPNGNYAVPDGVMAYKVKPTGVDGTTVTLTSVDYLYEGCGALVYSEAGVDKTATSASNRLSTSAAYAEWQSNNLLKGSPTSPNLIGENTLATSKDYVLKNTDSGPQFGKVASGMIARGKAYLHWEGSGLAKLLLTVMDEEETTSIESVDNGQQTTDTWYTLSGVKLTGAPTEKGVYIHNGRKEAVR